MKPQTLNFCSSLFVELIKANYKEPTTIELTNSLAKKMTDYGITEVITSDGNFSILKLNERI